MKRDMLKKAIEMAKRLDSFKLVTRDRKGVPFVENFDKIEMGANKNVFVSGWVYPKTLENLEHNREVSILIWNNALQHGYELTGRFTMLESLAMTDGYPGDHISNPRLPRDKERMIIEVNDLYELDTDNFLMMSEDASLMR